MEKQMIKSVKEFTENNEKLTLNYYLLAEKHVYGVCIESLSEEGILTEAESVRGVGCSKKLTLGIVQTLAENAVTPVTLFAVLDDLHERAIEMAADKVSEIA